VWAEKVSSRTLCLQVDEPVVLCALFIKVRESENGNCIQ
jgi:hypothetical protein